MYKILINYRTGDSFKTYEEEKYIVDSNYKDIEWSDLDIAKENLVRIQEHYNWVNNYLSAYDYQLRYKLSKLQEKELASLTKTKQKAYLKKIVYNNIPTFMRDRKKEKIYDLENYLYLLDDYRNEIKVCCFWNGFFESLIGASIQEDRKGWSFRT